MSYIRYLVTGAEGGEKRIPERYKSEGSGVGFLPVMVLTRVASRETLGTALGHHYDFSIFTSGKTAEVIFYDEDISPLSKTAEFGKIIAVGEKTAETIRRAGFSVDIVPEEKNIEGILETLGEGDLRGKRFFLPHGSLTTHNPAELLRGMGAEVVTLLLYSNELPEHNTAGNIIRQIKKEKPEWIIFQSPSGMRNFITLMGIEQDKPYFKGIKIAVIGKTTEAFAREQGLNVDFLPENPSLELILDGITG